METQNAPTVYEIHFKGHLGPNSLVWFENFTVTYSPDGETILRGPIIDQAALDGILTRILDLGLSLTFFQKME
jgi:hypothetical protein